MLTWIEDSQFLGQDQPIAPVTPPVPPRPEGWPSGVKYPPDPPSWWPAGLAYPPIGYSWAATAPVWWTVGEQVGSLPKWPPPKPDNWPATFPWPIPPSLVKALLTCEQICDAQLGPAGTTPDAQKLDQCKVGCQLAEALPPGQQPPPTGPTTFPFTPGKQPPAPAAPTPAKKASSAGPILIGLGLLALVGLVAFGGGARALD